jgi:hypothetical protein
MVKKRKNSKYIKECYIISEKTEEGKPLKQRKNRAHYINVASPIAVLNLKTLENRHGSSGSM